MFGSMKKALVAGAVVATAALAGPAMASADEWSIDGTNPFTGAALASGSLTMSVGGTSTTCDDINATIDLTAGATGEITDFTLADCSTTVPNCAVSAVASALPWDVVGRDGSPDEIDISGISFTNTYSNSGGTCALNGLSLSATGSLTGQLSSGVLSFTNAPGLTTLLGPATVTGAVTVGTESTGAPIEVI